MNPLTMTIAEREAFLADVRVGVIAIERRNGPPLAVPVWYSYEPGGDVTVLMDRDSLKSRLLELAGRMTLCTQSDSRPYRYVSVEGQATLTLSDLDRDWRPMARRYLGEQAGDAYADSMANDPPSIRVAMRPERWFTVDYSKIS